MMNYKYNIMHNVLKHLRLPLQAHEWCLFLNGNRNKPDLSRLEYDEASFYFQIETEMPSLDDLLAFIKSEVELAKQQITSEYGFVSFSNYSLGADEFCGATELVLSYYRAPTQDEIVKREKDLSLWEYYNGNKELVESTYNSYVDNGFKFE